MVDLKFLIPVQQPPRGTSSPKTTVENISLVSVALTNTVLLVLVLTITTFASRCLGFSREDEIAIVFCGSKKSLAAGIRW